MPARWRILALSLHLTVWAAVSAGAQAENAMGYQLLSEQEARGLPSNRGALGMDLARSERIISGGMAFDILQVTGIRGGSPAAKAGLRKGDQIIALDGRVFASLSSFAAYVHSLRPGTQTMIDYMPAGGGPAQAERVAVVVGEAERLPGASVESRSTEGGLSTGTKLAIGAGAAALLGCYELGCFSRHNRPAEQSRTPPR